MENKVRNKQSERYTTTEIHHSFGGTEGGGDPGILRRDSYIMESGRIRLSGDRETMAGNPMVRTAYLGTV